MTPQNKRLAILWLIAIVFVLLAAKMFAAPADGPKISVDVSGATPRPVEDQTQQSIARDYGKSWQTLAQALQQNRADLLNASFVGFARDRWGEAVAEQAKSGLSRKLVDHGHKLQVLFYSIEGSAMQLRDTAQLEIQYMDGGKVVHSEQVTAQFVVLMTPAENSWKVRMLQQVPSGESKSALLHAPLGSVHGGN